MNATKSAKTAIAAALLCGASAAAAEENINSMVFQAPIQEVYNYVSKPNLWHEWHPASLGADSSSDKDLAVGEHFKEQIRLYGKEVEMDYKVVIARPPYEFKTAFVSPMIDGSIHYQLEEVDGGTHFTRTLNYSIEKYLTSLQEQMQQASGVALSNLKERLESSN
ncbi:SRPBCC family protein [Marinobacter sp. NFXS9]|uniref:SRPBCC family protein n=1 Tax=Marinobacter sp. NFXS9 TaxID=2818433 RepID=UPI0032DF96F5